MSDFARVLVLYPRGVQTGGPEAIHQLVSELRGQGVAAFLVPDPATTSATRVPDYEVYGCPEVSFESVGADDLLVLHEMSLHLLGRSPATQHGVWWLSIDNSPAFFSVRGWLRGEQGAADLRRTPGVLRRSVRAATLRRRLRRASVLHLAQSAYARDVLGRRLGAHALMLSDYTTAAVVTPDADDERRAQRVAFNPRKGARMAERIQKATPGIEFVPLLGIPREEMTGVLGGCQIYLDTGHHPGKDRLPREAALAGCIVLVNSRGSGAFHEDVPLPASHKFHTAQEASAALIGMSVERETLIQAMPAYVDFILGERARFTAEVRAAFVDP